MRGRYKKIIAKLPRNGWHCEVDGYDFRRDTRKELERAVADYLEQYKLPGDAKDLVEQSFCKDNPDLCRWEND